MGRNEFAGIALAEFLRHALQNGKVSPKDFQDLAYASWSMADVMLAGANVRGEGRDTGVAFWSNDSQDNDIVAYRVAE